MICDFVTDGAFILSVEKIKVPKGTLEYKCGNYPVSPTALAGDTVWYEIK